MNDIRSFIRNCRIGDGNFNRYIEPVNLSMVVAWNPELGSAISMKCVEVYRTKYIAPELPQAAAWVNMSRAVRWIFLKISVKEKRSLF